MARFVALGFFAAAIGLLAWSWNLQKSKARKRFEELRAGNVDEYLRLEKYEDVLQRNYIFDYAAIGAFVIGLTIETIPRLCSLSQ